MTKKQIVNKLVDCFLSGGKVLICGNGGSASMANHMAGEFICTFEHDRQPLPAISLTTNGSILTAWGNDKSFEDVFSRQVMALGRRGDVLVALSTSGRSKNVLNATTAARSLGIYVIDWPRKGNSTAHIQEYQLKLMHDVVREVELYFTPNIP